MVASLRQLTNLEELRLSFGEATFGISTLPAPQRRIIDLADTEDISDNAVNTHAPAKIRTPMKADPQTRRCQLRFHGNFAPKYCAFAIE